MSRLSACLCVAALLMIIGVSAFTLGRQTARVNAGYGSRAVGYYTCGTNPNPVDNAACHSVCNYRNRTTGLNTCSNWDKCKTCLQQRCDARCTVKNANGKTKKTACEVHYTGESIACAN